MKSVEGETPDDTRAGEQSGFRHELTALTLLSSKILGFKNIGFGVQAHKV